MKKKVKLAIVGSRSFNDYGLMTEKIMEKYSDCDIECIISGGAKGADRLGAIFANENNITLIEHKPDWERYGKSAGFIRNKYIIDDCTHCIAFWDGESHGTKNDIDLCQETGKPCDVIIFTGDN